MNSIVIVNHFTEINTISKRILVQLKKDEPSFDTIREELDKRQKLINNLEKKASEDLLKTASEKDKKAIQELIDEFENINKTIGSELSNVLDKNNNQLNTARKSRKAEDSYHVLDKPDISYYQRN